MKKRIHLICNAHLDPVWQWEWEEGAAEALSTFRIAADFCEEYDGFIFNHNEAILYRWIEEYEPSLFRRIQRLVKEGKWHIMGGWHVQPDCNMPCGESFVRQILDAQNYFREKFDVIPTTAINFDPFGHTRGLVQILTKCGYDSYVICRPGGECPVPDELFAWVGYDGSQVDVLRFPGYNTGRGHAVHKVHYMLENRPQDNPLPCLWGVGNHGGGPSRIDLEQLAALKKELAEQDMELIHSTPEEFFAEMRRTGKVLPRYEGDLNPCFPGCYTSMIRIKQKHRALENTLYLTEKMCTQAVQAGQMTWPEQELAEAAYDLLTAQFHDILPGDSIQPAEEMGLRQMDHGLEILSRVKARAFFALAAGQEKPTDDAVPVLIYNPHPYPIEDDFECEMMLWDQNWADEFSVGQVVQKGKELPTQNEKEHSCINLDWRKRVVFHARLEPMQMNRFDCRYTRLPAKPIPVPDSEDVDYIYFKNDTIAVKISKKTGYMEQYTVNGEDMLQGEACVLHVVQDSCDPWEMAHLSFSNRIGRFTLLSPEEGSRFSGVKGIIPSVRCVESGPVRVVIEAALGYGRSRALIRYTLSRWSPTVKIDVRVQWAEVQRMLKLGFDTKIEQAHCLGQVAFGVEDLPVNGRENVSQKYLIMKNDHKALAVCNDGLYGSSAEEGQLFVTLLRSPAYCGHPIGDREILPQDRFTPHMEQGERLFSLSMTGGPTGEILTDTPRQADFFNQRPMALSFYPAPGGEKPLPLLTLSGDPVEMPALKQACDGNGWIVRLFNPFDREACCKASFAWGAQQEIRLTPYEVKTFRIAGREMTECPMLER